MNLDDTAPPRDDAFMRSAGEASKLVDDKVNAISFYNRMLVAGTTGLGVSTMIAAFLPPLAYLMPALWQLYLFYVWGCRRAFVRRIDQRIDLAVKRRLDEQIKRYSGGADDG